MPLLREVSRYVFALFLVVGDDGRTTFLLEKGIGGREDTLPYITLPNESTATSFSGYKEILERYGMRVVSRETPPDYEYCNTTTKAVEYRCVYIVSLTEKDFQAIETLHSMGRTELCDFATMSSACRMSSKTKNLFLNWSKAQGTVAKRKLN